MLQKTKINKLYYYVNIAIATSIFHSDFKLFINIIIIFLNSLTVHSEPALLLINFSISHI